MHVTQAYVRGSLVAGDLLHLVTITGGNPDKLHT